MGRLWLSTMKISELVKTPVLVSSIFSSGLSGLSTISPSSHFSVDEGYSPNSTDTKLLLNLSRLQFVSRESRDELMSSS